MQYILNKFIYGFSLAHLYCYCNACLATVLIHISEFGRVSNETVITFRFQEIVATLFNVETNVMPISAT